MYYSFKTTNYTEMQLMLKSLQLIKLYQRKNKSTVGKITVLLEFDILYYDTEDHETLDIYYTLFSVLNTIDYDLELLFEQKLAQWFEQYDLPLLAVNTFYLKFLIIPKQTFVNFNFPKHTEIDILKIYENYLITFTKFFVFFPFLFRLFIFFLVKFFKL